MEAKSKNLSFCHSAFHFRIYRPNDFLKFAHIMGVTLCSMIFDKPINNIWELYQRDDQTFKNETIYGNRNIYVT